MEKITGDLSELQQILKMELDATKKNHLIKQQNKIMKQLLHRLAFQIFLLVADADGKIDPKEVAQFRKYLAEREKRCTNKYTRRIFHSTIINYSTLVGHYQTGRMKKDITQVVRTLEYVEICVPPQTMLEICHDLKELAVGIAEASGGLMGLKSPISQLEQTVIDQLTEIFQNSIAKSKGQDPKTREFFDFLNF
ncbi:hypothetical protein KJ966_10305 [bacterium]|nr:hypothetical protein [bacterium]